MKAGGTNPPKISYFAKSLLNVIQTAHFYHKTVSGDIIAYCDRFKAMCKYEKKKCFLFLFFFFFFLSFFLFVCLFVCFIGFVCLFVL